MGVWGQSLVGEPKISHGWRPENQNTRQEQRCNRFNNDFKNGSHQKKKNNVTKSWFFEKFKEIENHLTRLSKKKFTKNKNKIEDITTNFTEIKRITSEYYEYMPTN